MVVAADLNATAAGETVGLMEPSGDASSERVDVSDPADTRKLVRQIVERHGRLDVMVNCAAIL